MNPKPVAIEKTIIVWLIISTIFLSWYFMAREQSFVPLYYVLWIGFIGTPLWVYRKGISAQLTRLIPHAATRFLALAYGAVALEETIAAFVHALTEGPTLGLLATRITQFWSFNLIAFSGLILAWLALSRRFRYSPREAFYLVGLWGLYAEGIIWKIWSDASSFLFFALPTVFTYGIIMAPSIMTAPTGKKTATKPIRYALALTIPFLCSIPFVLILGYLRARFPDAFPPCAFIAC